MLVCNLRRVFIGICLSLVAGGMITGCQNAAQGPPVLSLEATLTSEAHVRTPTATDTLAPTLTNTPAPPPTLIPQTPPATRAPVACLDDAEWVIDLSLQPAGEGAPPVLPSTGPIEKGWRVQNTGTCTWDSAYILAPSQPAPPWALPDEPITIAGGVTPGEMLDLWVHLQAPFMPGVYQAEYVLQDGRGMAFGSPLTLVFEVAVFPTGTPLPDVYLVASPLEVYPGEEAAIAWSASQAKAAYIYRAGQAWQEHPVDVTGSMIVELERTTTYELRAVNGDDSVEISRITIEVVPFAPPKIKVFRLKPEKVIDLGQCVDILWQIAGRVNTVNVLRNDVPYWTSKAETGGTWDCPTASGIYRYTLQAVGPGGVVEAEQILEVR
jgi:hypothetical protein